jgi:hypothetical protein
VFARRENVHLSGAPKRYVKTAESGRKRFQYFCPDCGTPIYVTGEGEGAESFGLRWGAIRQRALLSAQARHLVPLGDAMARWPGRSAGSSERLTGKNFRPFCHNRVP